MVSELLFRERPDADEGDLSRLRARIVRGKTLAEIATELQLGASSRLGEGELKSGGHRRESILADTLEAVLGAIYIDSGFPACRQVIQKLCLERIAALPDAESLKDPKTRLQEWLQQRGLPLPGYRVREETGADHARQFTISCEIAGKPEAAFIGIGSSRQKAQQAAAKIALRALQDEQ